MYNIYAIYILMQISIYIYRYTQKRLSRQSSEKGSKWSHSEKISKKKLEKDDSNYVLTTNLKIKASCLNLQFQWGNFSRIFSFWFRHVLSKTGWYADRCVTLDNKYSNIKRQYTNFNAEIDPPPKKKKCFLMLKRIMPKERDSKVRFFST